MSFFFVCFPRQNGLHFMTQAFLWKPELKFTFMVKFFYGEYSLPLTLWVQTTSTYAPGGRALWTTCDVINYLNVSRYSWKADGGAKIDLISAQQSVLASDGILTLQIEKRHQFWSKNGGKMAITPILARLLPELYFTRSNRPRSIYQYSNMAPRLSGQTSIFGVVSFVSKSLTGIEGQTKLEKYAILTRKPRSRAWILRYRTWPITIANFGENYPLGKKLLFQQS